MRLLGYEFKRASKAVTQVEKALSSIDSARGWHRILEPFAGAWQRNVEISYDSVLSFHAVYACITLIASDIAKLRVKLVQLQNGVWIETTNPAYSPVLRKPNHFQNHIQFWENWILSKLINGNTYVLKMRDARNVVIALYILDPNRVQPRVSDDGSIFYEIAADNISGITGPMLVPAREIIHDRGPPIHGHPLCGVSPIFANALAATQGMRIQNNSVRFFGNNAQPSGILTAPGNIPQETADRLKKAWEDNFSGQNYGRVAVLGSGLTFEKLAMTAVEGQLIEQLKWTAEVVCSTLHVPPWKIGIGQMPTYNNIQALTVQYYTDCLQKLIEDAEACLDEGLGIGEAYGIGTEFDIDNLFRMDGITQMEMLEKGKWIMTPNEQRRALELPPVRVGGDVVLRQEQDHSLEALAKRDAQPDPFNPQPAAPIPAPAPAKGNSDERRRAIAAEIIRRSKIGRRAA